MSLPIFQKRRKYNVQVNGKQYDFKFNTERISIIEAAAKTYHYGRVLQHQRLILTQDYELNVPACSKRSGSDKFLGQTGRQALRGRTQGERLCHYRGRDSVSTHERYTFFIPSQLVANEYFNEPNETPAEKELKAYLQDIDFAWFVVNFNYTKADCWL